MESSIYLRLYFILKFFFKKEHYENNKGLVYPLAKVIEN